MYVPIAELPTTLLYDKCGLRLFDEYTTDAKDYHIYAAELDILKNYSDEKPGPPVTYYALALNGKELRRTLGNLACDALDDGLDDSPRLHILFFGSSFRNFQRDAWAAFLRILPLRPGSGDTLLLAMDHVNDKGKIDAAHNDSQGYGGAVLGDEDMFDVKQWKYANVRLTMP
ncbi:hypothetical protein K525DRAFT_285956 [Schizophyllum commune Loenen D]|nr:hypothetical protein K525DRAFT_285956 [Schizophyllum commune Loenen D]